MNDRPSEIDRLLELLTDRAMFGLSDKEQAELDRLAAAHPEVDNDSMDQVAALVELSGLPIGGEELPQTLQRKILAAVPDLSTRSPATVVTPRPSRNSGWSKLPDWTGWAIAGALLIALLFTAKPIQTTESTRLVGNARERLLESATDLVQVAWEATDDEAASGASGDVVWSNAAQEGYLRFSGLATNDPKQAQYQLWIFDAEQDEKYPIDGGVFDIPSGTDEVIVPISAKLAVAKPTMFAVTVEKPGGVVVSSRERLPLLAKVAG